TERAPCRQRHRRGDRRALRRPRRSDHPMHRDDDRRRDGRARRRDREHRCERARDGYSPMTIRTQVIPDSGVKTAVPALEPLLVEIHEEGRAGRHVRGGEDADALIPAAFRRRAPLGLPELSEPQVVRHFTHLAQLNYAVDTGMYPLGSCTMKYNPKVNDRIASLAGFADIHPRQDDDTIQGALRLLFELEQLLVKLTGMDAATLQPAAGAHAEFTALLVFKAYHSKRGDGAKRRRVIVPDTAHGTNPASAAMCGYTVTTVKSDSRGNIDLAS